MNQAASVTGRPPAGSTATASCCPFLMNTFGPQVPLMPPSAQQCFLNSQASQIQQLASTQPTSTNQQLNAVPSRQQHTVSQQPAINAQSDRSQQLQRLQDQSNQSTNISLNNISNYNTLFAEQALSLHLLANRHPTTNCVALAAAAAAIAATNFSHQQQLQHQNHLNYHQSNTSISSTTEATTTNQPTTNSTTIGSNAGAVTSSNQPASSASIINQVPSLNSNSYNSTPQNLNTNAQNAPPTVAAQLNHTTTSTTNQHQQQSNLLGVNQIIGDLSGSNRPLATNNNLLNNIENLQQQAITNARRPPVASNGRPHVQQLPGAVQPPPPPNPIQLARTAISDETLNSLLNERFPPWTLLNQLNTHPPSQQGPNSMSTQQQQQTQQHAIQQPSGTQHTSTRSQYPLPNQMPTAPAQQAPTPLVVPQQRLEQVSNQHQPGFQQVTSQPTRINQVPVSTSDAISSSIGNLYQRDQQPTTQANNPLVSQPSQNEPNVQPAPASGQQLSTQQSPQQQQQQPQQPQQPQQQAQSMPSLPYYSNLPMELLALVTNPTILGNNNLFGQFLTSLYFQSGGLRSEQHSHPNPSHHTHMHHLHGAHHHHHHQHGNNGPANGHDPTIPVDSLAISESKPKGLNRAEIDSLTHYIHTDEKDNRICVICLSKFELKSKIRPLSCNHAFHAKCVDKWLRGNRTCPICRRDALKTYEGKIKRV